MLARGLLERDVSGGEGTEAAGDDGHRAELGPRLVDHVGARGVLLAVLAVSTLQVVVGAGNGNLHGCGVQSAEGGRRRGTKCGSFRRLSERLVSTQVSSSGLQMVTSKQCLLETIMLRLFLP